MRFWTPEAAPLSYAIAQHNLGNVYHELPSGDRAANLAQAIHYFQQALRFYTPEAAPFDNARTQNNLGVVYSELPSGTGLLTWLRLSTTSSKLCAFIRPKPSHSNAAGSLAAWLTCTLLKEHGMQHLVPIVSR